MSSEDRLRQLVADKSLHYVDPLRGQSARRYVYLLDPLHQRIEREVREGGEDAASFARVMALLYSFIHGNVMTFAMDPHDKKQTALMARTDPIALGIVDFRVLDPRPGMRLMGGFVSADHFVGMRCFRRDQVGQLGGFGGCVKETHETWARTFGPGNDPIIRHTVREYVTSDVLEA